ncbi:DsbA family protein [Tomitella biformata]|uniref:DsbA family protein n=1 Tax=Tomitella biformata TaxID=630403 RepID=UPI0004672B7E|nr:thioredoxin domain-containing protein [Tomitella biformata]
MFSGLTVAGALVLGACSSGSEGAAPATAAADSDEKFLVSDVALPAFGPEVAIAVQDQGVVQVGQANAGTAIDVYVDPLCPACATFDSAYGSDIEKAITAGDLAVRYHTLDFLAERSASGDFSTRAAAASLCVAEGGDAAQFVGFHSALFNMQPKMGGSDDLSNGHLSAIASAAGASEQVLECVATGANLDQGAAAATSSSADLAGKNDGKVSTPSVFAGTEALDFTNRDWVAELTS